MYQVLVVDDESMIRQSISTRIPWNNMGYSLVGACENGRQAIEKLDEMKIDVVLTDISMPHVDGLELASYIHKHYPRTKTIIISCYDEFEFAKRALQYQVFSYIIKPITARELIETLNHVKNVLDTEHREERELTALKTEVQENKDILKNQFLLNLLNGKTYERDCQTESKIFDFPCDMHYYSVGLCVIEKSENEKRDTLFTYIESVTREMTEGCVTLRTEDTSIMIFYGNERYSFMNRVMKCCEQIHRYIQTIDETQVSVYLGSEHEHMEGIAFSYEETKNVRNYRFLFRDSCFLYWRDFERKEASEENVIDIASWRERVTLAIRSHLNEEIMEDIHDLSATMRSNLLSRNRVILLFQNLILSIMEMLALPGVNQEELYHEEYRFIAKLGECEYLYEAEDKMISFCIGISDILNGNRDSTANRQAIMAMEYIEKHYSDCNLSLQTICDYLSISISYFSSIFKDYHEETFIEALTRIRVNKAKELFDLTAQKMYEVAYAVGYSDAHYFSVVFKKITGVTPSEYMKGKHI